MDNDNKLTNWTETFERALALPKSEIHAEYHRIVSLYLEQFRTTWPLRTLETRILDQERFSQASEAFAQKTGSLVCPRRDCQVCQEDHEYWDYVRGELSIEEEGA